MSNFYNIKIFLWYNREDITKGKTVQTESDEENIHSELKAAAESGWDFSSQWFILNGKN